MAARFVAALAVFGLGLLSSRAFAYELERTASDVPLRWPGDPVDVRVNVARVPAALEADEVVRTADSALVAWIEEMPVALDTRVTSFRNAEDNVLYPSDRVNTVDWVARGWDEEFDLRALALTVVAFDTRTGEILDADIAVNAEHYDFAVALADGCAETFDLPAVLTHEFGHFLGMAHSGGHPEATMYPRSQACRTEQRSLDDDDIEGIQYLYEEGDVPRPGFAPNPFGCVVAAGAGRGPGAGLVFVASLAGCCLVSLARREFCQRGRRKKQATTPSTRRPAGARAMASLAALAWLVAPLAAAQATTLQRANTRVLAAEAELVVDGVVMAQRVFALGGRVYTDTDLAVRSCWKGPCAQVATVRQLGGEWGELGVKVNGTAAFTLGEQVVIFARVRQDGCLSPLGMAQGVFHARAQAHPVDAPWPAEAVRVGSSLMRSQRVLVRDLRDIGLVDEGRRPVAGDLEIWEESALREQVN